MHFDFDAKLFIKRGCVQSWPTSRTTRIQKEIWWLDLFQGVLRLRLWDALNDDRKTWKFVQEYTIPCVSTNWAIVEEKAKTLFLQVENYDS